MSVPDDIVAVIEPALIARDGKRKGDEITFRAPCHDDQTPSASYNTVKGAWYCQACGKGGGWKDLATQLGIKLPEKAKARSRKAKNNEGRHVATYDYRDEAGALLFQKLRYEPKDFWQRRPDGNGGWIRNLDGVRRVLYRTPDLIDPSVSDAVVYVVEGEKDVERLRGEGLVATCNTEGACDSESKWLPQYSEQLRGRDVIVIPDHDEKGHKHAAAVASSLFGVAESVAVLELPGIPVKGDVSDWLDAGGTVDQLAALAEAAPPRRAIALDELVATFRRWLHLPDPTVLYAALGAVAANMMPGDPVWMLMVGPPGSGKTETIFALSGLPNVHRISTLTEAALLSGTPKREKASDASGGLLRTIGDFGIIVAKDFTSVLALHPDSRRALLAALREIYDGHWDRGVGTDGGRLLSWDGKVGLIAGCTPTIDTHHGVMATMGERFVFCRLPEVDPTKQALQALDHVSHEHQMRRELGDAVAGLFASLAVPTAPPTLATQDRQRLAALASLAVRCRSAVDRDGYRREIDLVPEAELPARLACVLMQLHAGMLVVGVTPEDAWRIVTKCAFDSMPQTRRKVFELLRTAGGQLDTTQIASAIAYPSSTATRACEDLAAHGILLRDGSGKGKAHRWALSDWTWTQYRAATSTVPEMSGEPSDDPRDQRSPEMSGGGNGNANHTAPPSFNNTQHVDDDISGDRRTDPPQATPQFGFSTTQTASTPFYDDGRGLPE